MHIGTTQYAGKESDHAACSGSACKLFPCFLLGTFGLKMPLQLAAQRKLQQVIRVEVSLILICAI